MNISFYRSSKEGIKISKAIAKAMGEEFDPSAINIQNDLILSAYFDDIKNALSPRFDHINMYEFTTQRLQAYADFDHRDKPFIHLDQQLDQWLLSGMQVLAIRAFYNLSPKNAQTANVMFARIMMMAFDEDAHKLVREDMVALFTDFPEPLRIANAISIGALVFIACHELAHHAKNHFYKPTPHINEFEADSIGLSLMREVYTSTSHMKILKQYPHAEVGIWVLFRFWDLIERAKSLKSKQPSRIRQPSHPFAEERLAHLLPLLKSSSASKKLIDGFSSAMDKFIIDLGLAKIT